MGNLNRLDIVDGVSIVPWDWNNLGAAFGNHRANNQCIASRCKFIVRKGYDPIDSVDYGRIVEGRGDLGLTLRSKEYAFHLSASNLAYKAGSDDPLQAYSSVRQTMAGLKFTFAKEFSEEQYLAVSYDFKQRKPELSCAWSGATSKNKASIMVAADPVDRIFKLGAGLVTPGPEWRWALYDEDTAQLEFPVDDGSRHKLYVVHEICQRMLQSHTRLGLRLDVNRTYNFLADFFDYRLRPYIPMALWRVPFSGQIYNLFIPAEDEHQMRHMIRNWDFDITYDSAERKPAFALSRRMDSASLGIGYNLAEQSFGVQYKRAGVKLQAKLGKRVDGWKNPSLQLEIEPLSFL